MLLQKITEKWENNMGVPLDPNEISRIFKKLHTRKAKGPPSLIAGKNHVAMI